MSVYTVDDANGLRLALVELELEAEKHYYISLPLFPGLIFIQYTFLNLRAVEPFFAGHSRVTRIETP
jgi:hypothetical protein